MEITIKLTGEDVEQALAELEANILYDDLDCKIEVLDDITNENSQERFNWIIRTFTEDGKSFFTFGIQDRTYSEAVKQAESDIERNSEVDDWTIEKHY